MSTIDERTAKARFMLLNLVRLIGLALVMTGIAAARGAIALPEAAGWVLAFAGLAGFFFLPPTLARKWRSQDQ